MRIFSLFLFLTLFIHSMNVFASKVIGITCDGIAESLSLYEGRFLEERDHFEGTVHPFEWHLLDDFISNHVSIDSIERKVLNESLKKLKKSFLEYHITELPGILESEILIDRSGRCEYDSLIQYSKGHFQFSRKIYSWKKDKLFSIFLEALFLPLSTDFSPIGIRSLVYSLISGNYNIKTTIQNLEAYQNAGIPFFTLGRTRIDLGRKFHYDKTSGEVFAGFLYKRELIFFPEGSCIGSIKQPILFEHYNIKKAMVSGDCKLTIGGNRYELLENSFVQISRTGTFVNDPRDPYIEFIYLKPNQKIQNDQVDFISSADIHRPSKIIFSTDGDGKQVGYIQFLGAVWVNGELKKIVDYSNSKISRSTGKIAFMVLKEGFQYLFQNGILSVFGIVRFSSNMLISGEIEDSNSMIVLSLGTVKLERFSTIQFRAIHGGQVWKFTLGEDAILLVNTGEAKKFLTGEVITLDQNGFVSDFD